MRSNNSCPPLHLFTKQFLMHKLHINTALFSPHNLSAVRENPPTQRCQTCQEAEREQPPSEICPPLVMPVTFPSIAFGDNIVWILTNRQLLVNLVATVAYCIETH